MIKKNKIINLYFFILISLLVFYLIYSQIIYPTIIPVTKQGTIHLFADWSGIVNAIICHEKGFDVFINNPCDVYGREYVYGKILLYLPLVDNFKNFYFFYLPIIFSLIFIFIVINFFDFQNWLECLTILPFIFSVPVILAIERGNIDILIFIVTVLIAYKKNLILNYLLILFASLSKFYPVVLTSIFLYEKKIKIIILNFVLFLIIFFLLLLFQIGDLEKIAESIQPLTASLKGTYNFSFKALIFFLINFDITINNQNYIWIKYSLFLFVLFLPLFLLIRLNLKYIFNSSEIQNIFFKDTFQDRLYVLSSIIILFCYFSYSNYLYREIFFIGLLPWILLKKNLVLKNSFFKVYFYALAFKFLVSSIIIFLIRNDLVILSKTILMFFKHSIDFLLIIIVLFTIISAIRSFCLILIKN